jgi:filamentous hemagglutinin
MIIAIVMAAVVGPAALTAMSGMGTFWAASYAAVATGAATNAATSFINNGGNLGAVFKDVTSSDALAGYVISGVTAGLTAGYFDSILKTTTNPITGQVMTDLSSLEGIGRFAGNQLLQNTTSTVLGATFGQHANFGNALTGALLSTLNAAAFNAVGDFAAKQGWKDGSLEKIALHAVVGGLLTEAAGGDFKTGALAAGANEALVTQLATLVKNDSNLLSMSSQLVGIAAAAVSDGNLQEGATIAKDATNYNYLMHHEIVEMLDEQAKCASETCKAEVRERYANLDEQRNAELGSLCQKNLSACKQLSDQLLADQPKIRELAEQLRLSGDIGAAANVGWIITENNQTAQNTIIREIVVQRDGESAAFWADAAGVAADVAGGGKPGGSKGTTKTGIADNTESSLPNSPSTKGPSEDIPPATSAISRVGLKEDLAGQAGIPRDMIGNPSSVWGRSIDDIKQSLTMDGATATLSTKSKTSGNAQVYEISGSATGIKEIQYSPSTVDSVNKSTHIGEYYRITYSDNTSVKVVDPDTYRPQFKGPNEPIYDKDTLFMNPQGQEVLFNPATNKWVPK